ncbi:MAG: hypothetical protein NZ954_08485 [Thermofilaceae archaeon]|nr:hypothetical protein [Thermofilaceae archaeon]MDW8005028.1 hypothetical protein [Thermofilaceae archaeon]
MPSRRDRREVPESSYRTCPVCGKRLHRKNVYDHAFKHLLTVNIFYPDVSVSLSSPFSISFNGRTYVSTNVLECPLVSEAWVTFKRRVRAVIAVMLIHATCGSVRILVTEVAKAIGDVNLSNLVRVAKPKTVTVGGARYVLYKENSDSLYYRRVSA